MDGDMVDLPRFLEICRRHDAFSMVDEAHSIGVAGKTGRGLCEHFGCGGADFSMGTLSKALGSSGAYVAGSAAAIDYLRQKARTFIFSTAPDVAAMAAASAALSLLEEEPEKVARLRANTELFVSTLAQVGIEVSTSSAIVPIPVGDERVATEVSKGLFEKGFYIPEIRYPTVARGAARLRVALSALHAEDEIRSAALAIADFLKTAR